MVDVAVRGGEPTIPGRLEWRDGYPFLMGKRVYPDSHLEIQLADGEWLLGYLSWGEDARERLVFTAATRWLAMWVGEDALYRFP